MFLAGAIDIDASDKEARFIRVCDAFNIPLIWLTDTPAYMPGVDQEHKGIIRHGAKVIHAISEATVPKITIYVRKCYGGGNLAMCPAGPSGLRGDLAFAWPTSEQLLMSFEGAVSGLYKNELESAQNPEELKRIRVEELKAKSGSLLRHMFPTDDVIDPRNTRPILIEALEILRGKDEKRPYKKHENIPL